MKQTTALVIVDAGGTLTPREYAREFVDNMSLVGMARMGYDAVTIGEYDLRNGAEYLVRLASENGVPLVSANVRDAATGKLVARPFVVVEAYGVRVAITGVLADDMTVRLARDVTESGVTVQPPAEALAALVPELRRKADFVVLLAHTGIDHAKELAQAVPGIDFLVVGSQNNYAARLFEVGTTQFLQPGYKGQYVSLARLRFSADRVYQGCEGEAVAMDDKAPVDASMALLVKEHKAAVERYGKERSAAQAQEQAQKRIAEHREACIGVEGSCRRCHQSQYEQWLTTAHAKAFTTLEAATQSTNPACLKCHTTCKTDLKQDGSEAIPEELRGVQCESCHGIGTKHARDGSFGTVSVATCMQCHDKANSPDFKYAAYLPKVKH
ncbi:MAG: hypothetical protein FJY74_09560 [Candidatus Eisenbacteria bacterium]|nr:hypothetical protein [Candidatus Eisenbacteria bacterium]